MRFHIVFNRFRILFISLSCRQIIFTENNITAFSNLSTLETIFKSYRFQWERSLFLIVFIQMQGENAKKSLRFRWKWYETYSCRGGPSSWCDARDTLLGVILKERMKCLISCRHAALKLCFCFLKICKVWGKFAAVLANFYSTNQFHLCTMPKTKDPLPSLRTTHACYPWPTPSTHDARWHVK